MLEHQSPAVDGFVVAAPPPICIVLSVLAAAPALLNMKVVLLIVQIDSPSAAIAPDDAQIGTFKL